MRHKNKYLMGAILSLCCGAPSWALDVDYTLHSSAEVTDNIRQSGADDDVSGNILRAGILFNINTDENATLAADVAGDFTHIYYSEGGLDGENRKNLDLSAVWRPPSTNFQLTVLNALRQIQEDRRLVRDVNNIRDYNIFSVIPSYHYDLTTRSRINTSYSYSVITDELDLASRDVSTVALGYEYQVSNLSSLSLNVSQSDIEFTDTGQELDQQSAFGRWIYRGRVTSWMLDVGRQRITEVNDAEVTLVNFSVVRQLNRISELGLYYRQGYGDVVGSAVGGRLSMLVPNTDAIYAEELAREKQGSLIYRMTLNNLEGAIRAEARRWESEEAVSIGYAVDEDRYILTLGGDYRFRSADQGLSRYSLGMWYRYMDERFNLDDLDHQINEVGVRLNYFASQTTQLFFELRSRNTSGTGPMSSTDENAGMVGIRFSPTGAL